MIKKFNVEYEGKSYMIIVDENKELAIKPNFYYLSLEELDNYKQVILKAKEELKELLK